MRKLEKQLKIMKEMVKGNAEVHQAFIEMIKLIRLMDIEMQKFAKKYMKTNDKKNA